MRSKWKCFHSHYYYSLIFHQKQRVRNLLILCLVQAANDPLFPKMRRINEPKVVTFSIRPSRTWDGNHMENGELKGGESDNWQFMVYWFVVWSHLKRKASNF